MPIFHLGTFTPMESGLGSRKRKTLGLRQLIMPSMVHRIGLAFCLFSVVLLVTFVSFHPGTVRAPHPPPSPPRSARAGREPATFSPIHRHDSDGGDDDIDRVKNATLGFEKILVLHLDERFDKRDALSLAASVSGLDFEFLSGVKSDHVIEPARPLDHQQHLLYHNMWGSWRGHMTAIRTILEQKLTTALILEDDVDWDVQLKTLLHNVALGTRWLTTTAPHPPEPNESDKAVSILDATTGRLRLSNQIPQRPYVASGPADSPYGPDWDVLWFGHNSEPERHDDDRRFQILNDRTVPTYDRIPNSFGDGFDPHQYPQHTRIVHPSLHPVGSFGYALSRAGAQKVLYMLSVGGLLVDTFDTALARMCRHRTMNLTCISTNPTLFGHYRRRGRKSHDSDTNLNAHDENAHNEDLRDRDSVEGIVYSTRLNLERLILGQPPEALLEGERSLTVMRDDPDGIYFIGSPLTRPSKNETEEGQKP
ncbi:MAG: hypothetical protein M1823_004762 [Watsoniomyces obsoletus]|nr:MAG: hypothetical protein M1823_004762 [Watsoniomyces obsoletus]